MATREIIRINENQCDGCGLCIPNCPEGAIQMIGHKARLISDLFCDGLGACLGHCPQKAITIEKREAQPYDENKVMMNIVQQGSEVIRAHLEHLQSHHEDKHLEEALIFLKKAKFENPLKNNAPFSSHSADVCPGSRVMEFNLKGKEENRKNFKSNPSELRQWPIQIMLVPPQAPYLKRADLLVAADCVPFAYPDFHQDLLKNKALLVGCPKLDDLEIYQSKISQILEFNEIQSITYVHMEVPCCFGLVNIIEKAIQESQKNIPFKEITVGIQGQKIY